MKQLLAALVLGVIGHPGLLAQEQAQEKCTCQVAMTSPGAVDKGKDFKANATIIIKGDCGSCYITVNQLELDAEGKVVKSKLAVVTTPVTGKGVQIPIAAKNTAELGNTIKFVAYLNCVKITRNDRGEPTAFEVVCEDCDTSVTKVKKD